MFVYIIFVSPENTHWSYWCGFFSTPRNKINIKKRFSRNRKLYYLLTSTMVSTLHNLNHSGIFSFKLFCIHVINMIIVNNVWCDLQVYGFPLIVLIIVHVNISLYVFEWFKKCSYIYKFDVKKEFLYFKLFYFFI